MTVQLSAQLIVRLETMITDMEQRIANLAIHRDQFEAWFDADLFSADIEHPTDYTREIRRHLQRLQLTEEATQQEWLAQKISDQLTALNHALALRQRA